MAKREFLTKWPAHLAEGVSLRKPSCRQTCSFHWSRHQNVWALHSSRMWFPHLLNPPWVLGRKCLHVGSLKMHKSNKGHVTGSALWTLCIVHQSPCFSGDSPHHHRCPARQSKNRKGGTSKKKTTTWNCWNVYIIYILYIYKYTCYIYYINEYNI